MSGFLIFAGFAKATSGWRGRLGSSHRVYKTPWWGNPCVNIQNRNGKEKPYQVRQILRAVLSKILWQASIKTGNE